MDMLCIFDDDVVVKNRRENSETFPIFHHNTLICERWASSSVIDVVVANTSITNFSLNLVALIKRYIQSIPDKSTSIRLGKNLILSVMSPKILLNVFLELHKHLSSGFR